MADINNGTYEARISNYSITTTKAGDAQIAILFEFNDQDNQPRQLTWYGSLKEKARPWTIKALLTCGLKGNDIEAIADGIEGGALDADTPVQIAVENEPGRTPEGLPSTKMYAKIKWINRLSGAQFNNALSRQDAKVKLGALNLKADVASIRHEMGIKDQPRKKAVGQNPEFRDADEDWGV